MSRALAIDKDGQLCWETKARGKRAQHIPGEMNKEERAYADYLELRRLAGEIAWYGFEVLKLRLAKSTFFTVDFAVMHNNGFLDLVDVKGRTFVITKQGKKAKAYSEEDARIKIKVAAAQYPMFTFKTVFRSPLNEWVEEIF